jgi:hypothetical protein
MLSQNMSGSGPKAISVNLTVDVEEVSFSDIREAKFA